MAFSNFKHPVSLSAKNVGMQALGSVSGQGDVLPQCLVNENFECDENVG